MSRIASAMSCSRFRGSLRRHRSSSLRMDGGCRDRQRDPIRIALEDADERVGHRVALERRAPGQHLVEHASECPDVGAVVDRLATRLLRTHVGRRAEHASVRRAVERAERFLAGPPSNPARIGFASPKSSTFARTIAGGLAASGRCWPASDRDGRCPCSCAASSASAIWRAMASASGIGKGPRSRRSASVGPSTSSRTNAVMPSHSSSP